MAAAGAAFTDVAHELSRVMPDRGSAVGAALGVAGRAGGRAAAVFERLAADAWDDVESDRRRRTLTAQARLSAWVVGALPVVAGCVLALSGRLSVVTEAGSIALAAMVVGIVLEVAGLAAVILLMRRVTGR